MDVLINDPPDTLLLVESHVVLLEWPVEKKPESRESRDETECHVGPAAIELGVVVLEPGDILLLIVRHARF